MLANGANTLRDGRLYWYPDFLAPAEAETWQQRLTEQIPWRQQAIRLFGRWVDQPRLVAWFGTLDYRYSGLTLSACPPPDWLKPLWQACEQQAGRRFNGLLLNRYRDGQDGMGWHADDEPELGRDPVIASLSLGQTRRFLLKHKDGGERLALALPAGSLLVMAGALQHHWLHALPKTRRPCAERINLTFRYLYSSPA
ncbi:alpha-ketoglutarate-dependent dioxygenase AlkB [Pseudaeromonas sp. ZJS20]|uniref:alpha-ketoglutarate-dependent dioxygenase AlkB family protein n=1 Tax=Pseudaeromonas aegiceratis TaxID=3153928 RepID=UPI00390CB47A